MALSFTLSPPSRRYTPRSSTSPLQPLKNNKNPTSPPVSPSPSLPSSLPSPHPLSHIHISPRYTNRDVEFPSNPAAITSSPFWRFMLLSDGHVVQHLSILSSGTVSLQLLRTVAHEESNSVQRTIALIGPDGFPLLFATSTWSKPMYDTVMKGREQIPLWEVCKMLKLAISRKVTSLHYGTCPELEEYFGVHKGTNMWARDYIFRQEGRVFLTVHEIFSPKLEVYLGPICPPAGF